MTKTSACPPSDIPSPFSDIAIWGSNLTDSEVMGPLPVTRNWFQRLNRWWLAPAEFLHPVVNHEGRPISRLHFVVGSLIPVFNVASWVIACRIILRHRGYIWPSKAQIRNFFLGPDDT